MYSYSGHQMLTQQSYFGNRVKEVLMCLMEWGHSVFSNNYLFNMFFRNWRQPVSTVIFCLQFLLFWPAYSENTTTQRICKWVMGLVVEAFQECAYCENGHLKIRTPSFPSEKNKLSLIDLCHHLPGRWVTGFRWLPWKCLKDAVGADRNA